MPDERTPRVGIGVDVHRLVQGRPLWVAGLQWPDEPAGLIGHSDGDVVAHAMCDALLSAAGFGDLGSQFGTADPRWADAHGVALLRATTSRLSQAGVVVGNVAVQLIGPVPRLADKRAASAHILTEACQAPVSLTATTSDGLGLTGRGEGLAAIATALVYR